MYTFPFKETDSIIELGGGSNPRFHPNVDVRAAEGVDIVADLDKEFPIESNKYDGLFCQYCIEHISWRKIKQFVNECYRILKVGGKAVFITANTERQMQWVLKHDEWTDECSSIMFGDQDYSDNTHKNSLNFKLAVKMFVEAGFGNVVVMPWGQLATDMIIEVTKLEKSKMERKELFDKHYFNGGQKVGGYAYEGYWDYPVHWVTFEKIMELKPQSVLELGAARGYLVKRFESVGIPARGLEISSHCHLTRVTDSVIEFDVCKDKFPFADKEFDLCYSVAVMEHIPEEFLPHVLSEIERVSNRGIHGIDLGENDDGFDKTHCTLRTKEFWLERMPKDQIPVDKEEMEQGSLALAIPSGDGKLKLNIGSFTNMYHNGWINIDLHDLSQWAQHHHYKFIPHNCNNPLPFKDNTVDYISSSHMLEHLKLENGFNFLKECHRVLKPGGVMRVTVPDTETLVDLYKQKNLVKFAELNDGCNFEGNDSVKLWNLLFSGHEVAYDGESLVNLGKKVGFSAEKKKFNEGNSYILRETFDLLPDLSLYVEFTK